MTIQYATARQANGATKRLLRNADVEGLAFLATGPAVDGWTITATLHTAEQAEQAAQVLRIAGYDQVTVAQSGPVHNVRAYAQENTIMDPDACPNPWHQSGTVRALLACPECPNN